MSCSTQPIELHDFTTPHPTALAPLRPSAPPSHHLTAPPLRYDLFVYDSGSINNGGGGGGGGGGEGGEAVDPAGVGVSIPDAASEVDPRRRYQRDPELRRMVRVVKGVLNGSECDRIVAAVDAALSKGQLERTHSAFATNDVPAFRLGELGINGLTD